MRRALAVAVPVAVAMFVALGLGLRARRGRAAWWGRAERLCACGEPTRRALGGLAQEAHWGLDALATAQRALLQSDCDDLRVAVSRRAWSDELARRPLRVVVTERHHEHAAAVTRSLGVLCGAAHEEDWQRLGLDLTAHANDPPADDPYRVRASARRHLAVREAMCRDRARLSAPPRSYGVTATEADRQATECLREVASPRR